MTQNQSLPASIPQANITALYVHPCMSLLTNSHISFHVSDPIKKINKNLQLYTKMLRACGLLFSRSGTHNANLPDNQRAATRRVWFYQIVSRWVILEKQTLPSKPLYSQAWIIHGGVHRAIPAVCEMIVILGGDRRVLHLRNSDVSACALNNPLKCEKYHWNAAWDTLHFINGIGVCFIRLYHCEEMIRKQVRFEMKSVHVSSKGFSFSFIFMPWT